MTVLSQLIQAVEKLFSGGIPFNSPAAPIDGQPTGDDLRKALSQIFEQIY